MIIREKVAAGLTTLAVAGLGLATHLAVKANGLVNQIASELAGGRYQQSWYCVSNIYGKPVKCDYHHNWKKAQSGHEIERIVYFAAALLCLATAAVGACYLYRRFKQCNTLPMFQHQKWT